MALFLFITILSPKGQKGEFLCLSIIIVTGRVTADPVMQQAKNSGTEYISLGLATNQRGQSGKENPSSISVTATSFLQID